MAHYNYGNLLAKQRKFAEAVHLNPAYEAAQKALLQARRLLGH